MNFPWQVAITLGAGIVMLALACAAQSQRKMPVARPFAAACLLSAIWCFIYSWQFQVYVLEQKIFILQLGFSIVAFLPVFTLETTYRFVHERKLFRGWLLVAVLIVPVTTAALAWTINIHPIFRYDCWVDVSNSVPLLRFKSGPWNAIFYIYCYTLALWSFAILLSSLRSATPWARRARLWLAGARIIPIGFDIMYQFGVTQPVGVNYAPASMAVTTMILAFIFFADRIGYRTYIAHSMLVEKISDLLVVLDGEKRVLDINRAAAKFLGTELENIQGQPVEKLFASWHTVLGHLIPQEEPVELLRDGKCFELTVLPFEPDERTCGTILWLRDITRRKSAELAHLAAATAAKEANRAKDRYLSVMSHEIRSPLNSVLGFMKLLETTSLNPEQKEYVSHVARSGDNLLGVINEVLDFAKIEAGRMHLTREAFDFRTELSKLCDSIRLEADMKGLSFFCRVATDVPTILVGDKMRISQILRNLLTNAVKFTAKGGISVEVDRLAESEESSLCTLRIKIADTGIGIAAREMDLLFQPFSQATPHIQHRYGGTGLGLLIARRFSELMGGTITVESIPQIGSTFTCQLQLGIGQSLERQETGNFVNGVMPSLRVLIVDDQPANRRLLEIILARMNHETEVAADGFECLKLLQDGNFDAVIMDIEMPGLDGFETSRKIRSHAETALRPYILAVTAHASTDIREQCFAAGMNGYLAKPISAKVLREALESVPGLAQR